MYLVMNIGCIECGEVSYVVKLTKDYDKAKQALLELDPEAEFYEIENELGCGSYFSGGENHVRLFKVDLT